MDKSGFAWLLCAALFVARVGDVASTRYVTPNLKLEMNPLVRKLRWRFALASLLLCLLPWVDLVAAWVALVMSIFVTYSNLRGAWLPRALGEDRYLAVLEEAARRSRLSHALVPLAIAYSCLAAIGALVLIGSAPTQWSYWTGWGIVSPSP